MPPSVPPVTPQPPAAPTGIVTLSGNTQNTISWQLVTGATSYNIYFSMTKGVTKLNGKQILNAVNPYIHTAQLNSTTTYYVVTAVNANGESIESAEVRSTAGVIDNHNGTIYIYTLNQTWPKCSQSDITGLSQYNSTLDNCSSGVYGQFQNCSTNDTTCAPAPGYILNGSGYSEVWLTCKNNTLAGRVWRVPRDNELLAFQPVYIGNQNIFSGITTDGYWSGNDDWSMAGRVMLYDGFESYPDRRWLNPVACVSDGI